MREIQSEEQPITDEVLQNYEGAEKLSDGDYLLWTGLQAFILFKMSDGIAVKATLNWDNRFEAVLENPTLNWLDFTMNSIDQARSPVDAR